MHPAHVKGSAKAETCHGGREEQQQIDRVRVARSWVTVQEVRQAQEDKIEKYERSQIVRMYVDYKA